MKRQLQGKYPVFVSEAKRDEYLCKLIAKGYQVKRKVVWGHRIDIRFVGDRVNALTPEEAEGVLYTIQDIDRRKGK